MTGEHAQLADEFAGVNHGYVVVAMLLCAVAGLLFWRYYTGQKVWSPPVVTPSTTTAPAHPAAAGSNSAVAKPDAKQFAAATSSEQKNKSVFSDPHASMQHFFSKLKRLEQDKHATTARMLFYGSSEIGFDRVTSQIRRIFQNRFGDGGKGFIVITPGWRYQRHRDIHWKHSDNWDAYSVRFGKRKDGYYGLGGGISINKGPAWVKYSTMSKKEALEEGYFAFPAGTAFSSFKLFYKQQPKGGSVNILVDGKPFTKLSTNGPKMDKVFNKKLNDGPHELMIKTDAKPNHLYGIAFERKGGFVLDTLMIIGAWAKTHLNFDADHLEKQIALRKADLVVFQFGAKEVFRMPDFSKSDQKKFVADFTKTVKRTMVGRPEASCLILTSKDMGEKRRNIISTRPAVYKVINGAQQVAKKTECAYLNLFEALGGEGTMGRWSRAKPRLVSPDLGHLMKEGAVKVGNTISKILLDAYDHTSKSQK